MEGTARQGWRKIALLSVAFAGFGFAAVPAAALDFSFGDDDLGWGNWGQVNFTWNTRLTAGVQMRTERRDYRLVDKQNVPANQDIPLYDLSQDPAPLIGRFDICEVPGSELFSGPATFATGNISDCTTELGDPRPGLRVVDAPGGYYINGDDGNLNYDRGDVTYANFQARSELTAFWKNFTFKVSGIGYYDPVNNDFDTHLADRQVLEYAGRRFPPDQFIGGGIPDGFDLPDSPVFETNENLVTGPLPIDRSSAAQRQDDEEDRLGEQLRFLEVFVAADFDIAGRQLRLAVGDQRMRWGESTFMIFNNLARINPPSAELYDRPGTEVRDAFIPVGMVSASMNVTTNFNVEAFYQYDWEPVEPSVCGSFLSTSDVAGCGDGPTPIYLGAGNVPEAPLAPDLYPLSGPDAVDPTIIQQVRGDGLFRAGGIAGTQTNGTRTIHLEDEAYGYPDDGGQFGLRLDYYADWLNGGTELSFYGMNIHSRLPFLSTLAAERALETDVALGEPNDRVNNALAQGLDFVNSFNEGRYRVDTLRAFLDYPEDIKIFGLSATTNAGDWSLAGEVSYSPNQPAQVSVVDVVYAGLQPAFPVWEDFTPVDEAILDDPGAANPRGSFRDPRGGVDGSSVVLPSSRTALPDYLSQYRCPSSIANASGAGLLDLANRMQDASNADLTDANLADSALVNTPAGADIIRELGCSFNVQEGDYVRGYERLKVGQISMTGIRVLGSSSPISDSLNADQIIFVGEMAAYKAFDMPGLDELQFQGSGASQTHYSQGVADFDMQKHGTYCVADDGCPSDGLDPISPDEPIPLGEIDERCAGDCVRRLGPADRIANFERADPDIFADDFAWGYRMRVTADYNNALFGWKWTPGFTFYHDVHGTSISPGQDFVEDRKQLTLSTNVLFTNNFSGNFQYRFYWGAGDRNLLLDRDYAELSLSYAF